MLGRTYHHKYGYPWRYAIPAEVWWRLEHCGIRTVERWAYPKRKQWERSGYEAGHRG